MKAVPYVCMHTSLCCVTVWGPTPRPTPGTSARQLPSWSRGAPLGWSRAALLPSLSTHGTAPQQQLAGGHTPHIYPHATTVTPTPQQHPTHTATSTRVDCWAACMRWHLCLCCTCSDLASTLGCTRCRYRTLTRSAATGSMCCSLQIRYGFFFNVGASAHGQWEAGHTAGGGARWGKRVPSPRTVPTGETWSGVNGSRVVIY